MQEFIELPSSKKSLANRKKMYDIGSNDVNYCALQARDYLLEDVTYELGT